MPAGEDVLDVGCGTGIASRQIAQRGAKVLGCYAANRLRLVHDARWRVEEFHAWPADLLQRMFLERVLEIRDPCLVRSCLIAQQNDAVDATTNRRYGALPSGGVGRAFGDAVR